MMRKTTLSALLLSAAVYSGSALAGGYLVEQQSLTSRAFEYLQKVSVLKNREGGLFEMRGAERRNKLDAEKASRCPLPPLCDLPTT